MTILKALVAEHSYFIHPGHAGVVGEEVGGKHGENCVEMIFTHDALDLHVPTLEVTDSLSPGAS
ncbi:MAG: hypothetical protein NWS14_02695, partial [Pontimonas sp.]|nr:hypothetical protein [Pontimonas sp.]